MVLGANGFIGKSTVQFLQHKEEYKVIPVTRETVDILDEVRLREFFQKNEIDVVIHCANQGGSRKEYGKDIDVIGNNLKMFFNIERCLSSCMRMINFGSGAQYDKTRDLIKVKEEEFGQHIPHDAYGYSKYVMSKYIKTRWNSGEKNILNPVIFGLYGKEEDYRFRFISNAIIKNIMKLPIVINQNVVFDYLFVEDYCRILEHLIEDEWEMCECNITPNISIDLVQIAELINEIGSYRSEIIVKNKGNNYQYTGDNTRLLEHIGRGFKFTSYENGICKLYEYFSKHIDEIKMECIYKDDLIQYCNVKK